MTYELYSASTNAGMDLECALSSANVLPNSYFSCVPVEGDPNRWTIDTDNENLLALFQWLNENPKDAYAVLNDFSFTMKNF